MPYLIAFKTILFKEIYRFVRIWPQTILPSAITTSLYFLIFGTLIGGRVGPMAGMSYVDYIVPGVILMSVITNAYGNVVASFYSTKFQRNIEEMLISPIPNWIILAGYVGGGIARGFAVGGVVGIVGLFFTDIRPAHPGLVASVFLLTAALFSLAGFINAIYANSFDDISIVPNFVLTPLVYLGGVFYSVDLLPDLWRQISLANPILYMINAFRYGFVEISDVDIRTAFFIIGGTISILIIWSLVLLRRGTGLKT
ncbi:ABC transporter permease [Methylocaldum szegediense]|uniref:Transport permease protein n=1 Tax=Methylocaldum szegediense TaxID=73780 RepID=A0ABN8XBM8_9GAMM|nr:ABC transporter permease [Methylocaldum szegediense]CAI8959445.1 putative ABC transporter membrane subunit YadH [Methylocaldum szegediense]